MKKMRRPRRRTMIIVAAGLLVGLIGLAAVVGVVRSSGSRDAAPSMADGGEALPLPGEVGLEEVETAKSLGEPSVESDEARAAGAPGQSAEGTTAALPPLTVPGQHLVRTGQLALVVKRGTLDSAVARVVTITRSFEGYVVSSAVGGTAQPPTEGSEEAPYPPDTFVEPDGPVGDDPYAYLTVRVPAERFDEAIVRFQKLGKVVSLTTSADDVSGQLVDLRARLRHYRAVEERLLSFLDKADTVEAALAVQDRIDQTQMMVEELEAQLERLNETVAYSTLSVTLTEKERPTVVVADAGGGIGGAIVGSLKLLGEGFRAIAVALAAALPFLAVIGVVGVGIYFVTRWVRRRRDRRPDTPGPGLPPAGTGRPHAAEGGPTA